MSILLSEKHSQKCVFVPISEEFVFFVMSWANRLQVQWHCVYTGPIKYLTEFKLLPTLNLMMEQDGDDTCFFVFLMSCLVKFFNKFLPQSMVDLVSPLNWHRENGSSMPGHK